MRGLPRLAVDSVPISVMTTTFDTLMGQIFQAGTSGDYLTFALSVSEPGLDVEDQGQNSVGQSALQPQPLLH